MPKLRVAIVAPTLDILGGHSVQAQRLLTAWKDDPDISAWLVPINPLPPPALRPALRVKYLRTLVTEATYIPQLVRQLARADVVHIFSASYSSFLLAPLPAMLVAQAFERPVVLNYHSGQAADHLERSTIARTTLAHVACNVVPSPFLAEVFARFGLPATVVPNIVDLDRFAFRERRPLRPRFLSTRNLGDPYNVACTLRAFRAIQDRCSDASLTVVGSGPEEAALRQLAAELRLSNVRFAGRVHPDEIADVYAHHDIYIQTPDIDNMPLSVIEAFASGLPVVSTEAGGMPDILRHGCHGLLAPVNDHEAVAREALNLLDAPELARRLAHNARATCESYTWTSARERWLQVYRHAAAAARRGAASDVDAARTGADHSRA
jgi:glycosyltransferase involved in cell wall biosynthesis